MIEYVNAIDEITAVAHGAWTAGAVDIVGYTPELRFAGIEKPDLPDQSKYWSRFSQETVTERQGTLRGECVRYRTTGLVFIQIFCPKSDSLAVENGRNLANLVKKAYRGTKTPGGVWFRNARINEIDPEKSWIRFNVIAEYEYDEIG